MLTLIVPAANHSSNTELSLRDTGQVCRVLTLQIRISFFFFVLVTIVSVQKNIQKVEPCCCCACHAANGSSKSLGCISAVWTFVFNLCLNFPIGSDASCFSFYFIYLNFSGQKFSQKHFSIGDLLPVTNENFPPLLFC